MPKDIEKIDGRFVIFARLTCDEMNWKYTGLALLLMVAGCGPSQEERAAAKLKQARMFLAQHDTVSALLHLDSIAGLYPKAAYALNGAQNLKKEIHWDIFQRKQIELDSARAGIARLAERFVMGKGEFERIASYTHKKQIAEENMSRSYLKAEVTEKGDLILVSQYYGSPYINHTSIRVYDGDLEAVTDTIPQGSPDIYKGGFLGARWERVTFRHEGNRRVAALVAANHGKKFKVMFSGTGKYVVFLEQADETAIREAYLLSEWIRRRQQLEREIAGLDIR